MGLVLPFFISLACAAMAGHHGSRSRWALSALFGIQALINGALFVGRALL